MMNGMQRYWIKQGHGMIRVKQLKHQVEVQEKKQLEFERT